MQHEALIKNMINAKDSAEKSAESLIKIKKKLSAKYKITEIRIENQALKKFTVLTFIKKN